jgi:citrate lyase subunit beta / citryl-CoA lyase
MGGVALRQEACGCGRKGRGLRLAIDCPFVAFADTAGYEKSVLQRRHMGCEGRMLIHPHQIEPSNRLHAPLVEDVEWARSVVKTFE